MSRANAVSHRSTEDWKRFIANLLHRASLCSAFQAINLGIRSPETPRQFEISVRQTSMLRFRYLQRLTSTAATLIRCTSFLNEKLEAFLEPRESSGTSRSFWLIPAERSESVTRQPPNPQ